MMQSNLYTLEYAVSRCGRRVVSAARLVYVRVLAAALCMAAAACSHDGYDTGDGGYSYITADMALLHTGAAGTVDYATLDGGQRLSMAKPFAVKWAAKPDTVYRALLYYDSNGDAALPVTARGASQVPVLRVADAGSVQQMHTDPAGLESVWMSAGGSYLNVSLLLKSGSETGDARQTVGVVETARTAGSDGRRRVTLQLYHDQGGVPEYYTVQQYASIDIARIDADVIELKVNTYGGEVTRVVNKTE